MSLYDRLCGRNELGQSDPDMLKIAIDEFTALLIEYTFDAVTRQQIIDTVSMDAGEIVQLDSILAKGANQAQRRELYTRLRSMLHLAEGNLTGYGLPSELETHIASI